ncbi:hypothetical protein GCM10027081_09150 [Cupriavidus yeoncheonensis]
MAARAVRGKGEGGAGENGAASGPADKRRQMPTVKKHLTMTSVIVDVNWQWPIETSYCITTIPEILAILYAPLNRISASLFRALRVARGRRA